MKIARLTPPGRAAVGTILLLGPESLQILSKVFRFPSEKRLDPNRLTDYQNRPVFGFLDLPNGVHEETVVHFFSEEKIELNIHGGDSIAQAVLKLFLEYGAEQEDEFRSDGSIDGEVQRLLPFCPTEKTAALLLMQTEELHRRERQESRTRFESRITAAKHLTVPFTVLIAGPPNAGKSSLLNALLGFHRVIVDSKAGTTRDAVAVETVLNGWPVRFVDTAGIRNAQGDIERLGIELVPKRIESADLLLLLYDTQDTDSDPVRKCAELLAKMFDSELVMSLFEDRKRITVLNKIDRDKKDWAELRLSDSPDIAVSAKTGENIKLLEDLLIKNLLGPELYTETEVAYLSGVPIALPIVNIK